MAREVERIIGLLTELDRELTFKEPVAIYLIGGGAITLAYDHRNRTADLDLVDPPKILAKKAGRGSILARKYGIYISPVYGINFSVPDDWKEKSLSLPFPLKNLKLFAACVEDIVLGKLARMEPKDLEDIIALHQLKKLDPKKLLNRLNENLRELKEPGYRNNVKLLFQEIFGVKIAFVKGNARFA